MNLKMPVELLENLLNDSGIGQSLPVEPNGLSIRNTFLQGKAKETDKREAVAYLEFHLVIRQAVKALEDKNLEHHDVIIGWATCFTFTCLPQMALKNLTEGLPRDERVELFERVAAVADGFVAVFKGKNAQLTHKLLLSGG